MFSVTDFPFGSGQDSYLACIVDQASVEMHVHQIELDLHNDVYHCNLGKRDGYESCHVKKSAKQR